MWVIHHQSRCEGGSHRGSRNLVGPPKPVLVPVSAGTWNVEGEEPAVDVRRYKSCRADLG